MATINGLTSASASSAYGVSSKGIGGLATGLDTDEIIKGMTIGTRAKIAKQLQSKQLLSWQTDAYRNVSNKLIDFAKKFTSFTSSTNLLSSSFYTKTDITTSGTNASKVSVSGSSTITDNINIISATRASVGGAVSVGNASDQKLSGDVIEFSGTSDFAEVLADKNISFSLNSTSRGVSFSKDELEGLRKKDENGDLIKDADGKYEYDSAKFAELFQSKLDSAFGKGNIKIKISAGGALEFTTSNSGSTLKVSDIHADAQGILGLNKGDSNRLDLKAATSLPASRELFIAGSSIDITDVVSTEDLLNKINNSENNITVSYIESLDRFEFKTNSGDDIEISGEVANQVFGGTIDVKASSKAQLTVQYGDGSHVTLESDNNTFNIDSLTVNVNETFASGDPIRLSAKTDTEKVFAGISDMVKQYNDMVDLVNNEYSTKQNKSYPPLTDEQKQDMSESEIKSWEDKAKIGMLFGNTDMSALSRELRTAFFSNPENMAALNSIGVTSSSNWKDNGKIVIDEDKLKKSIGDDPTKIKELFSDGVMSRLKNITDKYAKTEGSTKGILIEKAGSMSSPLSLTKNTLIDKMNSIDKNVANLKRTLSAEQSRYYTQFSNLEKVISKLNMQSGWLTQQFG